MRTMLQSKMTSTEISSLDTTLPNTLPNTCTDDFCKTQSRCVKHNTCNKGTGKVPTQAECDSSDKTFKIETRDRIIQKGEASVCISYRWWDKSKCLEWENKPVLLFRAGFNAQIEHLLYLGMLGKEKKENVLRLWNPRYKK